MSYAIRFAIVAVVLGGCGNEYHPEYHPVTATSTSTTIQTGGAQPIYVPAPSPPPPPPVPPENWPW
jgi:hypothetical protein